MLRPNSESYKIACGSGRPKKRWALSMRPKVWVCWASLPVASARKLWTLEVEPRCRRPIGYELKLLPEPHSSRRAVSQEQQLRWFSPPFKVWSSSTQALPQPLLESRLRTRDGSRGIPVLSQSSLSQESRRARSDRFRRIFPVIGIDSNAVRHWRPLLLAFVALMEDAAPVEPKECACPFLRMSPYVETLQANHLRKNVVANNLSQDVNAS